MGSNLVSRVSLPQNYQRLVGTIVEDFEDASEWVEGSGITALDSVNFKTGTQAIQMQSTSGTPNITKDISIVTQDNSTFSFWLYIPDIEDTPSVRLYLSDQENFSTYYYRTMSKDLLPARFTKNGWNLMYLHTSDFQSVGGPTWDTTMIKLRIQLSTDNRNLVIIDSLRYQPKAKTKVLFTWDDAHETQYTEGYLYTQPLGINMTYYLETDAIDSTNSLTSSHLATMYAAMEDLGNHTIDHTDLSSVSAAVGLSKITGARDFLNIRGYTRASNHFAYPFGEGAIIPSIQDTVTAAGMVTARGVNFYLTGTANGVSNPLSIGCFNLGSADSLAARKQNIDDALAEGNTVIFYGHKLVVTAGDSTEWDIADFQALVDYALSKQNQGLLDIVTISDWYDDLEGKRQSISRTSISSRSAVTNRVAI